MAILDNIIQTARRFVIVAGRLVEYLLTGEAQFNIYTEDGHSIYDQVTDLSKGKLMMEETKIFMRRNFGIILRRPVVLRIQAGNEFNLKGIWMELRGVQGQYHFENMGKSGMAHMIYMQKGLDKKHFQAILAHEMTHAFLRENELMGTDRYLREGFARWVEYHAFESLGLPEEAEKIRELKTWRYGRAVQKFFELERKVGKMGVLEVAAKIQ